MTWKLWRQRKARTARQDEEAAFALLAKNSRDVFMRHSEAGITYISPAAREIFGVEPQSMLGRRLRHYVEEADRAALMADSARMYRSGAEASRFRFRIRRPDGALRWVEANRKAEMDRAGLPTGYHVTVLRDVTVTHELEERLASAAMLDGLTGIANRRAFDEALTRCWRQAVREHTHLSLLLLDIDHFKLFNDMHGHQAGDECLRRIAQAMQSAVKRPQDFLARYGGEELVVLLPETDGIGAVDVASRVMDAVRELKIPHECNAEGNGMVSASIGAATAVMLAQGMESTPGLLVMMADEAMYNAKGRGRNTVWLAPLLMVAVGEEHA